MVELSWLVIGVVNVEWDQGLFLKSVKEDTTRTVDEALKDLYQKLRPGDPPQQLQQDR